MKAAIYWIVGPTGKAYIGSSQNVTKRLAQHRRDLRQGKHGNSHLQNAVNKYGIDNFLFAVLEYCEIDKLIEREQFHIDTQGFDTLYNARPIAESNRGVRHGEAVRAAQSARMRSVLADPSIRAKMAEAKQGHVVTPETRAKMSAAHSMRAPISAETRAKMSEAARNRSPEHRAKLSEAARNRSPEYRAKRSASLRRRRLTEGVF